MNNTSEILRTLKTLKQYVPPKKDAKLEVYGKRALIIGCISFLVLAAIAFWHINIAHVSDTTRYVGLFIGLVTYVMGLFSIVALIIFPLYRVIKSIFKDEDILLLLDDTPYEYEHEKKQAQKLNAEFPSDNFEGATQFLTVKINRYGKQIRFFFGSNISIVFLFFVLDKLQKKTNAISLFLEVFNYSSDSYWGWILIAPFALVLGLVIGALAIKGLVRRYTYRLEIIEMALLFKKQEAEKIMTKEKALLEKEVKSKTEALVPSVSLKKPTYVQRVKSFITGKLLF